MMPFTGELENEMMISMFEARIFERCQENTLTLEMGK